jgi:hypothetical protein
VFGKETAFFRYPGLYQLTHEYSFQIKHSLWKMGEKGEKRKEGRQMKEKIMCKLGSQ